MVSEEKERMDEALKNMREAWHDRIAEMITTSPLTYKQIGDELGCCEATVYLVARLRKLGRYNTAKKTEAINDN